MNQENSSFGDTEKNNLFEDIQELKKSGATSDTYKVRLYGKWHFLKRLKTELKSNPLYIQAFEKEFDIGFQLDHPSIVKYNSKGNDQNGIYLVTEYIEGANLQEFIADNKDFFNDKKLINKLIKQLLAVLDYLHNNQVIHLDIKPENILITAKGKNIKLIDLGFSSSDGYEAVPCGTKTFASPEQFGDTSLIDVTSDIYAIGRILIYLFTGNTDVESVNKLPQPYRKISKRCLRIKSFKPFRNVQEIINQIEFQKNKGRVLIIAGVIISLFLIYSTVIHFTMNKAPVLNYNATTDSIQFDVSNITNHMDSVFSVFDRKFPEIVSSNINEASPSYNKILNDIYLWKEKQKSVLNLKQKIFYEEIFERICNEKTKKYFDSFNIITSDFQTVQNSNNISANHIETKPITESINHSKKPEPQTSTNRSVSDNKTSLEYSYDDSMMIRKINKSNYADNEKIKLIKQVKEFSTEANIRKTFHKNMDIYSKDLFEYLKQNDAQLNIKSDPEKEYLSGSNFLFQKFLHDSQSMENSYFIFLTNIDPTLASKLEAIYKEEINKFAPRIGVYLNRYE